MQSWISLHIFALINKVTAAILILSGPKVTSGKLVRAHQLAPIIVFQSLKNNVDPILFTVVIFNESSFNPNAISSKGALGLSGILPGSLSTRGYDHLSKDKLLNPQLNVYLGSRHLARLQSICKDPIHFLSIYNGAQRRCLPSTYSTNIVKQRDRILYEIIPTVKKDQENNQSWEPWKPEITKNEENLVQL